MEGHLEAYAPISLPGPGFCLPRLRELSLLSCCLRQVPKFVAGAAAGVMPARGGVAAAGERLLDAAPCGSPMRRRTRRPDKTSSAALVPAIHLLYASLPSPPCAHRPARAAHPAPQRQRVPLAARHAQARLLPWPPGPTLLQPASPGDAGLLPAGRAAAAVPPHSPDCSGPVRQSETGDSAL